MSSDQAGISILLHFAYAFQLGLGIVFLFSSLSKLWRPHAFVKNVTEYNILPVKVSRVFAITLIPLESFLALAFFTGWLLDSALLVALVILFTFLVAVGINLKRGRRISCGCFGNESEQISPRTFARLLILLTAVLLLIAVQDTSGTLLSGPGSAVTDVGAVVYLLYTVFFAVFLIVMAAWLLSLPELVPLIRHLHRSHFSFDNTGDGGRVDAK